MTRNEILSIRSLQNRNERKAAGRFVVEGFKGVLEMGKSNMEVARIYCVESMVEHIPSSLSKYVEVIDRKSMVRISTLKTPPGMLAVVNMPEFNTSSIIESLSSHSGSNSMPFILVADGISDPGNLGTLIRTADWFGMCGVLTMPGSTDPWSPKCVQASMGSVFNVPIAQIQTEDIATMKPQHHYALDMQGHDYTEIKWKPGFIWIGSESHGMNTDSTPFEFEAVHIPRRGGAESLNAGIAGAIVCAEIARIWTLKS